ADGPRRSPTCGRAAAIPDLRTGRGDPRPADGPRRSPTCGRAAAISDLRTAAAIPGRAAAWLA
ncbi:MAG: hypothetical protein ACLPS1_24710, partial [Streptosporangiaceae bacterium]